MSDDAVTPDPAARYRHLPEPVSPGATVASAELEQGPDQDDEYRDTTWLLRQAAG